MESLEGKAQQLAPATPKFKIFQWRLGNPISWSTLKSLVFHPLNVVMSMASFFVVVGSILSHFYLYAQTLFHFEQDDIDTSQIDIMLPHCIMNAAATDITIHEYFQLQRDDADETLLTGIDLHVKHAFFHSRASIELYMATIYFVSLKPICSSLFFYVGPMSLIAASIKIFNPSPEDLRVLVNALEMYTGWKFNDSFASWLVTGEHIFAALIALILTELSALISHDIMRLFCCEWKIVYDDDVLALLLPITTTKLPSYGTALREIK